jgi:hypothetical protein
MTKISIINGSQKPKESNSGIILDALNKLIKNRFEVKNYKPKMKLFTEEIYNEIISVDVIVLAFPLYGHSIPANTLKMLIELERVLKEKRAKEIIVYTIINLGFFEAKQAQTAFENIQHWCKRSEVKFGGGIAQGAGEMMGVMKKIPLKFGLFNNLWRALKFMVRKISLKESFDIIYLTPYWSKFLWRVMGNNRWNKLAQKNGLSKKDIVFQPMEID